MTDNRLLSIKSAISASLVHVARERRQASKPVGGKTRIGINGLRLPGLGMVEYANASNADFTLAANDQWTRYGTGNNYPSSAYATADESATLTQNSTTYTDYVNVMVPKFITGTEELTPATFQKFVDRLMSLGVEENLQLRQEIYDRHIGK